LRSRFRTVQTIVRAYRALIYRGGIEGDLEGQSELNEEFGIPPQTSIIETRKYQKNPHPHPLKGDEGCEGAFLSPQEPSNSPQKTIGSSSVSRNEENSVERKSKKTSPNFFVPRHPKHISIVTRLEYFYSAIDTAPVRIRDATKSLLFLPPRTRIGFGFPASAACSQNLNI
jgi:hypothetical protein